MLKGINILVSPTVNSGVERYRLKIWRNQGAIIKDRRYFNAQIKKKNQLLKPDTLYILANDLATPQDRNDEIEDIRNKNVMNYPILKMEWITESLSKQRLLPIDQFIYRSCKRSSKSIESINKRPKKTTLKVGKHNQIEGIISILQRNRNQIRLDPKQERALSTNANIIDRFKGMINLLEIEKLIDSSAQFRIVPYSNAINMIETLDRPICSSDDVKQYYGFGKSLQDHIDEILKTGTFTKYEHLKRKVNRNAQLKLVNQICQIHRFGPVTAYKIIQTYHPAKLDDLKSNKKLYSSLSKQQKLGLNYYHDWLERIPRNEVASLYQRILDIVKEKPLIEDDDNQPVIKIMGSYLRGSRDCGDIDLMIYRKGVNDSSKVHKLLYKLVTLLEEQNFINCELTNVSPNMNKFNGGCILKKGFKCRRIDIIAVEYKRLGSAMLYFVGNDTFNRGLRLLATLRGERLSDQGLVRISKNRNGVERETMIESFDEHKILDHLGVKWVDYTDRNV